MERVNLTQKPKKLMDDFVDGMAAIYKEGLVSVILYGSAASGEYTARHSNINLLVVLKDASMQNLAKASALLNRRRFALVSPIFLTEDYILNSTDVFPIEFLDMKENHALLYGRDILADLQVDIRGLRFQCEQELKSKLINMKRMYLKNMNSARLDESLFRAFTSILHILRNIIRLKGGSSAYSKEDMLKDVEREFKIDTSNFSKILAAKSRALRLGAREARGLFCKFVDDLEKIARAVNKL